MFSLLVSAFTVLCSSFRTRAALQLEILALRHQINVLRRSQRGRVHLRTADRLLRRLKLFFSHAERKENRLFASTASSALSTSGFSRPGKLKG